LLTIGYVGPRILRGAKVQLWLIWRKIASPASDKLETELSKDLPHELEIAFFSTNLERDPIAWVAPCVSTSARGVPGNLFGYLVATKRLGPKLAFVAKRGWRHAAAELDLTGYKVAHEPKFLSENVVLYSLEKKPKYIFLFARSQRPIVKAVVASVAERLAAPLPSPEEAAPLEETMVSA
jgi:hypothetical protein